jgi:iron complex outermembrane receptor protein
MSSVLSAGRLSARPVSIVLSPLVTLATLSLSTPFAASAQSAPPPAASASASAGASAGASSGPSTVVVTGHPLGRDELALPATVLSGEALARRRAGTLGATLDGLPGVASAGFGPQSARPVIRGLDGDRIRLLDNGAASADASSLSFDHAVAIDPLLIDRVEVLRGPAALLYGGSATGGVVNTIDNRVPREALSGLGGRAELRFGGAAKQRAGAALLEGGNATDGRGFSWHADAAARRTDDQREPRFTPVRDGEAEAPTTRVINSAGDSRAGAVGGSWADRDGYLGAAVDALDNDYGVAVEPDVTIRLKRRQLQLAGERRSLAGPFSALEFRASQQRYRHDEVEGSGDIGTTFRSTRRELRVQATQAARGPWRGIVGLQLEQLDFEALGEEAFVPGTRTRNAAAFTLQEWQGEHATLGAGLRLERASVRSDGDTAAAEPRFGAASERRFSPLNAALSLQVPLADGFSAAASLAHTERAPAYYELYANGLHVATGVFERGDPALKLERGRQLELGLGWKRGAHRLQLQAWGARFSNFIALDATGARVEAEHPHGDEEGADDEGEHDTVPEYAFSGVPARLHGVEIDGRWRLADGAWRIDAGAGLDWVRGSRRDTGAPLPRLSPLRTRLSIDAARGAWQGGVALKHAARQDRFAPGDIATPAHTLVDLWAGWTMQLGGREVQWTLQLDNAFDRLAYSASTIRTAREVAPQAGRSLALAVRVAL